MATHTAEASQQNLNLPLSLGAGTYWLQYDVPTSNDTQLLRLRMIGAPGGDTGLLISTANAQTYAHILTTAGQTTLRFQAQASWEGTLDNVRVYDLSAISALPADIYGLWGQSNIVGTDGGDPSFLDAVHPMIWAWARDDDTNYGITAGALNAAYDPLMHAGNGQRDVGPGMAFANAMLVNAAGARRIVIVCAGEPNTRLSTGAATWAAPTGANYDEALTAMQDCKDALPAGSEIKGIVWSQGESDYAAHGTAYAAAFAAMVADARSQLALANLPFVILGTDPDEDAANGGTLQATQVLLDEDSGDATAIERVKYVPTPAGYRVAPGSSHMTGEGHRIRGWNAAAKMIECLSEATEPNNPPSGPTAFSNGFSGGFA
ncbi:MAG: sialate O-acetylesterase [Pseudomonadota bacterium]